MDIKQSIATINIQSLIKMASTSNEEELKSGFEIDNLKGYHHCDDLSHDYPHHQHSVTFRVPLIGGIPSILTSFRIISS